MASQPPPLPHSPAPPHSLPVTQRGAYNLTSAIGNHPLASLPSSLSTSRCPPPPKASPEGSLSEATGVGKCVPPSQHAPSSPSLPSPSLPSPSLPSPGDANALNPTTARLLQRQQQLNSFCAATEVISVPTQTSVSRKSTVKSVASPAQSLDDQVDTFLSGPSYRSKLTLPPLLRPPPLANEDLLRCLRNLVERRAWGDVLKVSADLLTGVDSIYAPIYRSLLSPDDANVAAGKQTANETLKGFSPLAKQETAEIMALQCHGWLKLRRYTDLGQEIERWNFLHYNDSFSPCVDWVPWSLHIIAAETLQYTMDDPVRGTDELYAIVDRIPNSEDIRWKLCSYRGLANAFARKRDWRMATASIERMLPFIASATRLEMTCGSNGADNPGNTPTSLPAKVQVLLEAAYRTELMSAQGRYLLHAGAVSQASHLFQAAEEEWMKVNGEVEAGAPKRDSYTVLQHVPAQLLANKGLVSFAHANYDQAVECFNAATYLLREHSLSLVYSAMDWVGPVVVGVSAHATLFNECINNMAICALYTCRMPEAVDLMESLIREDPTAFLTERIAFNLCTMYELECDSTLSARKKRVIQLVAKRFFLHDVGPESFRTN